MDTSNPTTFEELSAALTNAETKSEGQITAVYTQAAPGYSFVYLTFAVVALCLVSLISLLFGFAPLTILATQIVVAIAVFMLCRFTPIGPMLTPAWLKAKLAERYANRISQQLFDPNQSPDAHVVLMVSSRERFAKIAPSRALSARIPDSVWSTLFSSLLIDLGHGEIARGMRNSAIACEKLLSVYFPPKAERFAVSGVMDANVEANDENALARAPSNKLYMM